MNAQDRIRSESHKNPAQLEREIDEHRHRIEETVSMLESKISPQHVWEQVLSHGAGGGREFATRLGETVKTNPVPAVLTAIGLTWLYAGDRQAHNDHGHGNGNGGSRQHGMGHRSDHGSSGGFDAMKDTLGDAGHPMGDAAHDAMDSTRDFAHDAMDSGRHAAHSVGRQAHRASEGFQHMLQSNPLPLGAVGIAIGALLGALIPTTRQEDELMGKASDRLADEARDTVREVGGKISEELHDTGG